jgi:hypothetical protein
MPNDSQYLRACSLIVTNSSGNGLDLSSLRVVFNVKKTSDQTPNSMIVRVYNLTDATQKQIQNEFTNVILQAGYQSNFGVIFSGNIKDIKFGRENATDKYIEILAGDGDEGYNFSIINRTLASGSTIKDQVNASISSMSSAGISAGYIEDPSSTSLPRGKVMFGMSRDYLRQSAQSSDATWSVQDLKVQFLKRTSLLPGEAVVLNSRTGLIGIPTQTNAGIEATSLLNPLLTINSRVQLNENLIAGSVDEDPQEPKASFASDGFYRVLSLSYVGDTFGSEWYTKMVCLSADQSAPTGKQVSNS